MEVEVTKQGRFSRAWRALTRRNQPDGRRHLLKSDLEGITRLSEVIDSLVHSKLIPDDELRKEMATLFIEPGILRSLGQCVSDEDSAGVIDLATVRLQSPDSLTIYYVDSDGNVLPFPWPTTNVERQFRASTLLLMRGGIIGSDGDFDPEGISQSKDPISLKGESLAIALRVLQIVPYRSADDITSGSPVGVTPLIRFNPSTV